MGCFFFLIFIYLFIYLWLCWVFISVRGLSPVAASGGRSSSQCAGLSLSRPLLLRSTGSRSAGSVVVAHGPSRSTACGILPDQGSNPRPLHWQADSQSLRHQGSPRGLFLSTGSLDKTGIDIFCSFCTCLLRGRFGGDCDIFLMGHKGSLKSRHIGNPLLWCFISGFSSGPCEMRNPCDLMGPDPGGFSS